MRAPPSIVRRRAAGPRRLLVRRLCSIATLLMGHRRRSAAPFAESFRPPAPEPVRCPLLLAESPPSPCAGRRGRGPPEASPASAAAVASPRTSSSALAAARFARPLLEAGYAPAVLEYERTVGGSGAGEASEGEKPLLLYLPGFDGTGAAPFIQFPELGTEFDVRVMEIPMDDRSTFPELREAVTEYLLEELRTADGGGSSDRPVYLVGESFGGILALEVSQSLRSVGTSILRGLVLVNPATCYDRSALSELLPGVASLPPWRYPFGVLGLLPLFADEFSLPQLWMFLSSEGLPSVIDTAAREAYMGRMSLSVLSKVKFMPRDTLRWRLSEWLAVGCADIRSKSEDGSLARDLHGLPVLIVAGERNGTLPSVDEAERLASSVLPRGSATVAVVDGAGHAFTMGGRVDLMAEMRARFPELRARGGRTEMKEAAAEGAGTKYLGMEPRYDGAQIVLNPLRYWSEEYYRNWTPSAGGE